MIDREPRVLTWIARAFPQHEALYGDLLEELAHGRSPAWFYSQLLYACATFSGRAAWTAKRARTEWCVLHLGMLAVLAFASYVTVILGVLAANLVWPSL